PPLKSEGGLAMRARRVVAFAISLSCGNVIHSPGFSQEYRGTMGQQMACTPDVWRLCSAQVPDVDRIVACLRRNTPQLSRGCRACQGDGPPEGAFIKQARFYGGDCGSAARDYSLYAAG